MSKAEKLIEKAVGGTVSEGLDDDIKRVRDLLHQASAWSHRVVSNKSLDLSPKSAEFEQLYKDIYDVMARWDNASRSY